VATGRFQVLDVGLLRLSWTSCLEISTFSWGWMGWVPYCRFNSTNPTKPQTRGFV